MFKMAHDDDGYTSPSDPATDEDETAVLVAGHLSQEPQPDYSRPEGDHDDSDSSTTTGPFLDTTEPGTPTSDKIMAPRAYQLELFQASMEQNIIVSMDTGSGKTQVAVLRIQAELERTEPAKRVWFLAPTVTLCAQQCQVITSQIPAVITKMLTGDDNIESWSNQAIWDAVLHEVRVVVCTPQILFDALSHSFVTLDTISLLVFDEAHNCTGQYPGRRIMTRFYQPRKDADLAVPHILGLTASPVVRSEIDSMETLEKSLDAVCRGPTAHRDELLVSVNHPAMTIDVYPKTPDPAAGATRNMMKLRQAISEMDIAEDPYVLYLYAQGTPRSLRKLDKVLDKHDTLVQRQTRAFYGRCKILLREMGPWAVDTYICQAIKRVTRPRTLTASLAGWLEDEQRYLTKILVGVGAKPPQPSSPTMETCAAKLQALLRVLIGYQGNPVGIIFVKERATTAVLCSVLSELPAVKERYKVGCMVGTSGNTGRLRKFYDLAPTVDDEGASALELFRRGRINLLVATSLLEEGIDVPACNLVVCFDRPANLKSFIQRRGRARMRSSQLHLLLDDGERKFADQWQALESEMKRRYEDEMRELDHLKQLEEEEANAMALDGPLAPLRARDTAAELTIDDAKPHLEHFCRVIGSRKFVDPTPEYLFTEYPPGNIKAVVLLPSSLPPSLRRAKSSRSWQSQKNACKDAAFQAYKMLYEAGLLDQNLLPIKEEAPTVDRKIEGRPGIMEVQEQYNPWPAIVAAWKYETWLDVYRRRLQLMDHEGTIMCEVDALLPVTFPELSHIELFWTQNSPLPWTISMDADTVMSEACSDTDTGSSTAALALEHTKTLLGMSFGHRFSLEDQSRALRFIWPNATLRPDQIGSIPFSPEKHAAGGPRLVRDEKYQLLYIFQDWLPSKPSLHLVQDQKKMEGAPQDVPYLAVRKWPKICGILRSGTALAGDGQAPQAPQETRSTSKPYPKIIPADGCRVDADDLSITMAQFAMLIPSITYVVETYMVAEELLRSTRLGEIGFRDTALVVTALTASSSQSRTNYERVEFLGDSILKLYASVTSAANNLHFPEGYLSLVKDKIVSNARLCRAAVKFGLDRFIMTRVHTVRAWKNMLAETKPRREMSTKTLADVVEALIGAAHIEGGTDMALRCISTLLPLKDKQGWRSLEAGRDILLSAAPTCVVELPVTMRPLEVMLGYTFQNKALLVEAMTHSSYNVPGAVTGCLERLEFLGDSVLDSVVVSRLFAASEGGSGDGGDLRPSLPQSDMHLLRTAMVNGDFMAFLAMEWRAPATQQYNVTGGKNGFWRRDSGGSGDEEADDEEEESEEDAVRIEQAEPQPGLPLWAFMRHSSGELTPVQQQTVRRHAALAGEIRRAMEEDMRYPWDLLARLRAPKVFSDVFEAVIGAVWVDSGEMEACAAVAERAGILPYLRRCIADKVKILHPKEELGRLAGSDKVVYSVEDRQKRPLSALSSSSSSSEDDGAGEGFFECSVKVGKRRVASIVDGVTREEAKTRAAAVAVRLWEEAGRKWEGVGVIVEG